MALNVVTLTFTEQDAGGGAGTGGVSIAPTAAVTAAGQTVVSQFPVVRQFSGGTLSVTLVACDNTGTTPAAGFWAYNITLPGGTPQPYLVNFADGATQRFDNLTPAVASTTYGPAAGSGGFASPMTTLGDIIYENATPAPARLAGNTTTAKQFLTQTGTGSLSAAPRWGAVQRGDVLWPWQFYCPVQGSGSDDAAPIAAQRNAGIIYALNNQGYYELIFDAGYYQMKAAPTIGGTFEGNAIIPLTAQSVTAIKTVEMWRGAGFGAGAHSLAHWQQQVPQAAATVFVCTRTDGTNDATYGPAFVIGGPRNGYGGGTSLFSNEMIVIDGITIQVPWNGTYGGFGFFGLAEAEIVSASCMAAAVPVGGTSYPNMGGTNYASITNQWPVGLEGPDVNNNDNFNIARYSSEGLFVGARLSEHTVFDTIRTIYCNVGAQIGSASGTTMAHGMRGGRLSAENCDSAIVGLGAPSKIDIAQIDVENVSHAVYDPNNYLAGRVGLRMNATPGYGTFAVTGAANLRIRALDVPPGLVSSPPAVPGPSTNFPNLFYTGAVVRLTGGTGVSPTVDGMPVSASTPFWVRSGGVINLGAYSVAPTWQWELD